MFLKASMVLAFRLADYGFYIGSDGTHRIFCLEVWPFCLSETAQYPPLDHDPHVVP